MSLPNRVIDFKDLCLAALTNAVVFVHEKRASLVERRREGAIIILPRLRTQLLVESLPTLPTAIDS